MNRRTLNRILAAGQEAIDREAKKKAREAFLNEPVTCFMCKKTVTRRDVTEIKGFGYACTRHPGVAP